MARIQVYDGPFSLDLNGLSLMPYGSEFDRTAITFRAKYDSGGFDTVRGYGFTYTDKIAPVTGTVTAYEHSLTDNTLDFRISGLAIPVQDVIAVAKTESEADDLALLKGALSGADVLIGGSAQDYLFGYGGNDLIVGGGFMDVLAGGTGRDTFRFDRITDSRMSYRDTIKDFQRGQDKIDLSRIDADQDGTAGNQSFKFIGEKAFTGRDGELRFSGGTVYGDVNGDKVADFAIKVAGLKALSTADFIL
jgi:Ca2+-binding RTX toxin-like protein